MSILRKSDFFYQLPENLIAHSPIYPRDTSRLLVFKNNCILHENFTNIDSYLEPGDVLVLNDTKVIKAKLEARDLKKERNYEILLLKPINTYEWECLIRPAKKAKLGDKLYVGDNLSLEIIGFRSESGIRIVRLEYTGDIYDTLNDVGRVPLPPYIHNETCDLSLYQTVYAEHIGSVAAPTAGLHFTPKLLEKIQRKGVNLAYLTLHVGVGTFRPVKEEFVPNHIMHSEIYQLTENNANIINQAKIEGGRVIAVGTTSVRTLESIYNKFGSIRADEGDTNIFIYPPYDFNVIDGMVTNFHLPESTLLMLVSAFVGRDRIKNIYESAIEMKYRFYSFGDAMLLLK